LQCVAVCCSVLQCVAVCCSVLQCVAVCCSVLQCVGSVRYTYGNTRHLDCQLGGVCCSSVLHCDAVCCSVLQRVELSALQSVWQCVAVCGSVLHCDAVCCSVLQCVAGVAACCSVLHYVAVCCRVPWLAPHSSTCGVTLFSEVFSYIYKSRLTYTAPQRAAADAGGIPWHCNLRLTWACAGGAYLCAAPCKNVWRSTRPPWGSAGRHC